MRQVAIEYKDSKYIIYFYTDSIESWRITSYTLLEKLQEIIYLWCEKGIHPNFQYT